MCDGCVMGAIVAGMEQTATAPQRTRKLAHHGVQILPPRPERGNRYCALKYRDPQTNAWRTQTLIGISDPERARTPAVRKSVELDKKRAEVALHGQAVVVPIATESARYLTEASRAAKKGPNKGRPLAPNTVDDYRTQLDRFTKWCAARNRTMLGQITRADLSDFRLSLCEGRSNASVNFEMKAVRQMLLGARAGGRLDTLDSDAIKSGLAPFVLPDPDPVCLTTTQISALLAAAPAIDVRIGVAVALGLLAGLRLGEATALRVQDYSPRQPASDGGTYPALLVGGGKTGARVVELLPYSPLVVELLDAVTRGRAPDALLLGYTRHRTHRRAKRANRNPPGYNEIGGVCATQGRLGVTYKTLRSTCASYQNPLPGSDKQKADRLGHTLEVNEHHYQALPPGTAVTAPSLDAVMRVGPALRALIKQAKSYYAVL